MALVGLWASACMSPEATTIPDSALQTLAAPVQASEPLQPAAKPATPAPTIPKVKREGTFVVSHYGDSHSSVSAMPAQWRDLMAAGGPTSPGFVDPDRRMPGASVTAVGPWQKHNWIYGQHKGPFGPGGLAWSLGRADGRMVLKLKAGQTPPRGVKVSVLYAQKAGRPGFEVLSGTGSVLATVAAAEGDESGLGRVEVVLPDGQRKAELRVSKEAGRKGEFRFYGFVVQYPGAKVEYDAFGVIGATIRSPHKRADASLDDYMSWRKPDMLVMWYGSNSAYRKRLDMEAYGQQYHSLLTQMRARAPEAICVAVGPPDLGRTSGACRRGAPVVSLPEGYSPPGMPATRSAPARRSPSAGSAGRSKGVDSQGRTLRRRKSKRKRRRGRKRSRKMSEAPAVAQVPRPANDLGEVCEGTGPIPQIIRVQREAAYKAGCVYFDTHAWMGGPGSMESWRRERPPLAAGDFVHLTFAGYRAVAHGLYEAMPTVMEAPVASKPEPLEHRGAVRQAKPHCPAGSSLHEDGQLCVQGDKAVGPFTDAMASRCRALGLKGCGESRWDLEAALKSRGAAACPLGAQFDRSLGYCVDRKHAYGPFEAPHIARCLESGAGAVCHTMRWPRAITPSRPVILQASATLAPGGALPGGFVPHAGSCAVRRVDLPMVWRECARGMDCYAEVDEGSGRRRHYLRTPAVGPVAVEAHLVTEEDTFGERWPKSFRDGIKAHYARSAAVSGYAMDRRQPWAPSGEGGCQYGQGATGKKIPAAAEAWYINMFWRKRPPPGTRMIVTNPVNGRSVVAAAGYETGPGDNAVMAGVSEEIHHYLGSKHRTKLQVAFAENQSLPFGPIRCQ